MRIESLGLFNPLCESKLVVTNRETIQRTVAGWNFKPCVMARPYSPDVDCCPNCFAVTWPGFEVFRTAGSDSPGCSPDDYNGYLSQEYCWILKSTYKEGLAANLCYYHYDAGRDVQVDAYLPKFAHSGTAFLDIAFNLHEDYAPSSNSNLTLMSCEFFAGFRYVTLSFQCRGDLPFTGAEYGGVSDFYNCHKNSGGLESTANGGICSVFGASCDPTIPCGTPI